MSYSKHAKRNKIRLALSPFIRHGKWEAWRGYLKDHPRQYYRFPDTKSGYDAALIEFAKWKDSLKESRPWAQETLHHIRLFSQVEKWLSLHGTKNEDDEITARWTPLLIDWLEQNYQAETPVCPTEFFAGPIDTPKGKDYSQNKFMFLFAKNFVREGHLDQPDYITMTDDGFGSINYELPELWKERISQLVEITKVESKTSQNFGHWFDEYIFFREKRAKTGHIAGDTVRDAEQKVKIFIDHIKRTKIVSQLSDSDWQGYFDWLEESKAKTKAITKQAYLNSARTFLRWCSRQSECSIRIPDNFADPDISFRSVLDEDADVGDELSKLWTPDDIAKIVDSDEHHYKAFVLLSLNCGFLASDLNDVKHSQLKGNRLIHKRKKTRRKDKIKTVNYKLWDITVDAINKVKTDPEQTKELLETVGGSRILTPKSNGKGHHDNISRNWQKVRTRQKMRPELTLRKLRNTASQVLQMSDDYRDLVQLFLGHAQSTAGKYYHVVDGQVHPPLDEATDHIQQELLG